MFGTSGACEQVDDLEWSTCSDSLVQGPIGTDLWMNSWKRGELEQLAR